MELRDILSPTPEAPSRLGRYTLFEAIGEGGMARVYRAEMEGAGGFRKTVALKVIRPHLLEGEGDFVPRFMDEARLGGNLSHPNIVATLDFGSAEGLLYIAMEYVDGPTLHEVLRLSEGLGSPLPLGVALELTRQTLAGLEAAHHCQSPGGEALAVVHRDVKPSNLLLTQRGHLKIGDFGIARAGSNEAHTAHTGVIRGTLRYLSPEQAWGKKTIDHRSDLFSVAALLYEMLTLRPVYLGDSVTLLVRRAQDADVGEALEAIPLDLAGGPVEALLRRGLQSDPGLRFQSASAMGEAVEAILDTLKRPRISQWLQALSANSPGAAFGPESRARVERSRIATGGALPDPTSPEAGSLEHPLRVARPDPWADIDAALPPALEDDALPEEGATPWHVPEGAEGDAGEGDAPGAPKGGEAPSLWGDSLYQDMLPPEKGEAEAPAPAVKPHLEHLLPSTVAPPPPEAGAGSWSEGGLGGKALIGAPELAEPPVEEEDKGPAPLWAHPVVLGLAALVLILAVAGAAVQTQSLDTSATELARQREARRLSMEGTPTPGAPGGAKALEEEVKVAGGRRRLKAPVGPGTLTVKCTDACTVRVDRKVMGAAPLKDHTLKGGGHTVAVSWLDGFGVETEILMLKDQQLICIGNRKVPSIVCDER